MVLIQDDRVSARVGTRARSDAEDDHSRRNFWPLASAEHMMLADLARNLEESRRPDCQGGQDDGGERYPGDAYCQEVGHTDPA